MTEETRQESMVEALQRNFDAMRTASEQETQAHSVDAAPAVEEGVDEVEIQRAEAETSEEASEAIQPLETWSEDEKSLFNSLDPNAQAFVMENYKRFQSDYTKKSQELSERSKRYEQLDQVLSPYEQRFKQSGLSIAPYVAQSLTAYLSYMQNPVETVRALINQAKLTPEQLGFGEDVEELDPATKALRAEISQLKQQVSQQGQSQVSEYQSQIDRFSTEKDEKGELAHPHFESVRHLMAPLVSQGMGLKEAYAEAIWSLPEYRKAQLDRQAETAKSEAAKKAQAEAAKKVSAAKKAGGTLPAGDADRSGELPKMDKGWKGWENALLHTANR